MRFCQRKCWRGGARRHSLTFDGTGGLREMASNLAISAVLVMLMILGISMLCAVIALLLLRFKRKIAAIIVGSVALIFFVLTAWIATAIWFG